MLHITDREIAEMVSKARSTIANWRRDNPVLYEAVHIGCLSIKAQRIIDDIKKP